MADLRIDASTLLAAGRACAVSAGWFESAAVGRTASPETWLGSESVAEAYSGGLRSLAAMLASLSTATVSLGRLADETATRMSETDDVLAATLAPAAG